MSDVTRILSQIESGDPSAAEQLLPLVYDELRKLAAAKLAQEKPGQTLQATALVHDAYIRLVDVDKAQHWDSRGHFFAAAAEAMRRILVEVARHKQSQKAGGDWNRLELTQIELARQESSRGYLGFKRSAGQVGSAGRATRRPWSSCVTLPGLPTHKRRPRLAFPPQRPTTTGLTQRTGYALKS